MAEAYLDHAVGRYAVKTYGLPAPWSGEYGRLLRQKYGVELHAVAGCCVAQAQAEYLGGYNALSRYLLLRRYYRDVFAECSALAQKKWQAANPGP
jgi:hypothetical protein